MEIRLKVRIVTLVCCLIAIFAVQRYMLHWGAQNRVAKTELPKTSLSPP